MKNEFSRLADPRIVATYKIRRHVLSLLRGKPFLRKSLDPFHNLIEFVRIEGDYLEAE